MPESGSNQPPSFDPRPPGKRRRASDSDNDSSTRQRRQSRAGNEKPASRQHGFIGRVTGRAEMDRVKLKRYDPYTYESNNKPLKWVVLALAAWVVVALLLAWQDRATASLLVDISDQGYVSAPPEILRPQALIDFAAREGLTCIDVGGSFTGSPECGRLFAVQSDYESQKSRGSFLALGLLVLFLANMFAFGSFTHRASRNLLAMKSSNQKFTPEQAVMWFFIPVLNMVRPWQVFRELFRGSDPNVSTSDELEWKTKGEVPKAVHVWAAAFIGVFIFNARSIEWFWYRERVVIDDFIVAHQRLVIADLLLAVLGVAAIFVAVELHRRQEARHAKVGLITVTPPASVDPLEKALKEGIRRKDLEKPKKPSSRSRRGRDD
jgi:hypothetical protein